MAMLIESPRSGTRRSSVSTAGLWGLIEVSSNRFSRPGQAASRSEPSNRGDPIEQGGIDLPGIIGISSKAQGNEHHREDHAPGYSAKDRPAPPHGGELDHGRHGRGWRCLRGRRAAARQVLRPLRDRVARLALLLIHVAELDAPDGRPKCQQFPIDIRLRTGRHGSIEALHEVALGAVIDGPARLVGGVLEAGDCTQQRRKMITHGPNPWRPVRRPHG
jgi:hypothetical protein